jgi:ADP-heptose:LPS heptosyltransferase
MGEFSPGVFTKNPLSIRKVVVLRARKLGDLMCAIPSFRALRAFLPHADITLVGLPWAREFVSRFTGYINDFVEFPGYPGVPDRELDISRVPEFIFRVQSSGFDLAFQLHGSGEHVNDLVELFGAKQIIGFAKEPSRFGPKGTSIRYPRHVPESWRLLLLLRSAGIPLRGDHLEFPVWGRDSATARTVLTDSGMGVGRYICIHPGSASATSWRPHYFGQVGEHFSRLGYHVVITGSESESELARQVARQMSSLPIIITGKTSLGSLAAILQESRLLVCNDNGISHLAAALRVPTIVVVSEYSRTQWSPLASQQHRFLMRLEGVMPQDVLRAAHAAMDDAVKTGDRRDNEIIPLTREIRRRRTG